MMLTAAVTGSTASVAMAAPTRAEYEALKAEINDLTKQLQVEEAKDTYRAKKNAKHVSPWQTPNWDVSGDARFKFASQNNQSKSMERLRVSVDHRLSKEINFHVRWNVMDDNEFGLSSKRADTLYSDTGSYRYPDFQANDNNWLSHLYVSMDNCLHIPQVTIGRFGQTFGATGFWGSEDKGGIDGIKMELAKNHRLTVGFADFSPSQQYPDYVKGGTSAIYPDGSNAAPYYFSKGIGDAIFINGSLPVDKSTDIYAMYLREVGTPRNNALMTAHTTGDTVECAWDGKHHELIGLGFKKRFSPDFTLLGDFMQNRAFDASQNAAYVSLRYKGADINKKGSFGVNLDYRRIGSPYKLLDNKGTQNYSILCGNLISSDRTLVEDNRRGPVLGIQWTPTKDILVEAMQSFMTHNTETGERVDDYTSLSISTRF